MNNKNRRKIIISLSMVMSIFFAVWSSTLISATIPWTKDKERAYYILNQLDYEDKSILCYLWGPVSTGDKILAAKEHIFDVPCAGYVMYIDLYPMANMFHPVQYVFFAEKTKELLIFDANSPPLNFIDYHPVETAYAQFFFSIENTRAPLPERTAPETIINSRDNRWAVLMNGGYNAGNNHVRYWNDLSNIYITLNHVYDFPDENIIVLCSDGLNPAPDQSNGQNSNPDLDGDGDYDIMYSCVLSNVDMVFTSLANNFTTYNKLFVFTTDHGSSISGWSVYQNLWNQEQLLDSHFASLLAAFPECEKICTFEPCFSGGFLDNIIVPPGPIVGSSACRHDEYSWAMGNLVYDEYVFHWTAAVKGEDAFGNPVDADANHDGRITMDEAYIYAESHDAQPESPQYGEYPQDLGAQLSLWVSSEPPGQPTKPNGPIFGIWYHEYFYTTQSTDPENDQIYYLFDWGDGNDSGWLGPYTSGQTVTSSHIWMTLGNFTVKVKAQDIWGSKSPWSDPLIVTITDNTPPSIPQITGSNEGKIGKPYLFNLRSEDAQNHTISYFVDWGDNTTSGWIGPYISNTTAHVTHAWMKKGNYTVRAKAKDTVGAESDWGTFQVVMPIDYKFSLSTFFQKLMERFPQMFPILRHLLGR